MKINKRHYDKNIDAIFLDQEKDRSRLLLGGYLVSGRTFESVGARILKKVETSS